MVFEIPLENSAQAAAPAVQEDALVGLAQTKHLAHFGRRPALNIAKRDHDALRRRQAVQLTLKDPHRFAADDCILG